MVVHIANEVLENIENTSFVANLVLLFGLFELGVHEWEIMIDDDVTKYQNEKLQWIGEFVRKGIKKFHNGSARNVSRTMVRIVPANLVEEKARLAAEAVHGEYKVIVPNKRAIVTHTDRRLDVISIDLVKSYLMEKLRVVVENNRSDAKFITTVLKLYNGLNEDDFSEKYQLKFENGGGNSTPQVIEVLGGIERAVCVIDGDRDLFGSIEYKKVEKQNQIKAVCSKLGYDLIILNKREIENYIPDTALKEWLSKKDYRGEHPYFRLDECTKDHVDMKKVCSKHRDEFFSSFTEVAATSQNNPKQVEPRLGFGDEIWKAFEFVTSFDELKSRDVDGELERIVRVIDENL